MPAARVLVIDDDFDFVEYARIVLESAGYDVLTAETVDLGLALMRQKRPDVVLLDAVISYDLAGLSVSRVIQNDPDLSNIPVILVSAIVTDEELDFLPGHEGSAFDAFMSKPIEPGDLLEQVQKLVAERDAPRAAGSLLDAGSETETTVLGQSEGLPAQGDSDDF